MKVVLVWWLYALLFQLHLVLYFINAAVHLCPNDESLALLRFKQMFTINNDTQYGCEELLRPQTMSWNHSKDCCTWDGVTCDRFTGRVIGLNLSCSQLSGKNIQLNTSISHLKHLRKLNLANNDISGINVFREIAALTSLMYVNLSNSFSAESLKPEISLLSNLTKLRILSLANVDLSSEVPSSLLNLSKSLIHLDLLSTGLSGETPQDVFLHFPYLETLSLANNRDLTGNLPKSNWSGSVAFLNSLDLSRTSFSGEMPDSIGYGKSLNSLLLSDCNFFGSLPNSIGNLSQVIKMDLSSNSFSGPIPSSISKLEQLTFLDLSVNHFKSAIPDVFMHLRRLTFLNLKSNNLFGQFPSSAANLSEVTFLDFQTNSLTGFLPQIAVGLQKLIWFSLSNNSLTGTLPSWLFYLPSLKYIGLDYNQFTGNMSDFKSQELWAISMNNNKLSGQIPQPFSKSAFLNYFYISSNNFSGVVDLSMFPRTLTVLDISYNNLKWSNKNDENLTFPVLTILRLSSCEIKEIPPFIQYSNFLRALDLSENKIHGRIPEWFRSTKWDALGYLDLSHNYLTILDKLPWKTLGYLHLQSNSLLGTLPTHICELDFLEVLVLSDNNLTAIIPPCYANFSSLMVLDLRRNNFQGAIPTNFPESNQLKNIALNGNQLQGSIPGTLLNCQQLEVLDLGNNYFTGLFPTWLENLQELRVLILKANQFRGLIPRFHTETPFPNVRIFDISYNNFTGKFPENIFTSFKAMMNQEQEEGQPIYMEMKDANYLYYRDSMSLVIKGIEMEISRVLVTLTTIDLSSNKFVGDIPKLSIGDLKGLKLLNLSHNKIQGQIPSSLGELRKLESLDLSANQLEGEIPWQLTKLTSLAVLNLSENLLTGRIPQGNQFHTFGNNSYAGNLALCGFPLTRTCGETETIFQLPPTSGNAQKDSKDFFDGFTWRAVVMGYGCGLVLGVAIGCTMFLTGIPKWYTEIAESSVNLKRRSRNRNGRQRRK